MPVDAKSAPLISSNTSSKDLDYVFETEGHTGKQVQWRVPSVPSSWKTDMGKTHLNPEIQLGQYGETHHQKRTWWQVLDDRRSAPPTSVFHVTLYHAIRFDWLQSLNYVLGPLPLGNECQK